MTKQKYLSRQPVDLTTPLESMPEQFYSNEPPKILMFKRGGREYTGEKAEREYYKHISRQATAGYHQQLVNEQDVANGKISNEEARNRWVCAHEAAGRKISDDEGLDSNQRLADMPSVDWALKTDLHPNRITYPMNRETMKAINPYSENTYQEYMDLSVP